MTLSDYVVLRNRAKKRGKISVGEPIETVYGTFLHDFQVDLLSNLCSNENGIQTGPFGSQLHQRDYVSVGTPIITVEHLGQNRILHKDLPRVSDYDRRRLSRYALRQGDIVFSRVGSVDRRSLVRQAEEGWLFSGRCLRVRPHVDKIDPQYLAYFFGLPAFQEYIRSVAVGATMPSLNTRILSELSIIYPPLPEQRAIAHVLGTLDDKIELNRQMNETLEQMARALFKSWFVDFDPVRAKMEGRWRPGQSLPGLPAHLYDLFPSRLAPSELGPIPAGWRLRGLAEVCNFRAGSVFPRTKQGKSEGSYPFIKVSDMNRPGNSFGILDSANWVDDDELGDLKAKPIPNQATVFAKIGEALRQNRLRVIVQPTLVDNNMMGAMAKPGVITPTILRFVLSTFDLGEIAGGTALPYLTISGLSSLRISLPSVTEQIAMSSTLGSICNRVVDNDRESMRLTGLRDALLPKLVSGDVRVAIG